MTETLAVSEIVNSKGGAAAIVEIFKTLPGATLLLIALAVSGIVLLATTFDSAAYVLACATSSELGEGQEPEKANRLFWCFVITILPLALLFVGAEKHADGIGDRRATTVADSVLHDDHHDALYDGGSGCRGDSNRALALNCAIMWRGP
ncbi:BCCT family transporter [Pseudomonas lalucatii]|nr:BCCT family transporter [Pseudomonas lalucatii]MBS7724734.1 BCCT family transporter [Pseudomonas lalucatii]QVM87282.1 BCCT family transporter [Pseudomonas lalucatii]